MTPSQTFYGRLADSERMLQAALPGWRCWSVSESGGHTTWHARPDGALGAVVNADSADALLLEARAYQAQLPRHIQEANERLAALADNPVGQDQAAVQTALIASLTALQQRLEAATAKLASEVPS